MYGEKQGKHGRDTRMWIAYAIVSIVLLFSTSFASNNTSGTISSILDHLERGKPRDIYLARTKGQELVKRNRDCTDCLRVLARALDESGMTAEASRYWRSLLELEPDDTEALLALADHHTKDGMRYLRMVSGPIRLFKWGKEDLEKALAYLERLRQTASGRETAHIRLAELSLILENWKDVIRYASAITDSSLLHRGYALVGTALLHQGDVEAAEEEFDRFIEIAPDSVVLLYRDPTAFFSGRHFIVDKEDDELVLDDAQWDRIDPRILTKRNERLIEHQARVVMASVRCATVPGKWDGWRTQPGVMMIRYGDPKAEMRTRPEIGFRGQIVYEKLLYDYDHGVVAFEDQNLMGRFVLAAPGDDDPFAYANAVNQMERVREVYDPHRGEEPLNRSLAFWSIPRDEKSLVIGAADIPTGEIEFVSTHDRGLRSSLRSAFLVRDQGGEEHQLKTANSSFTPTDARGCPENSAFNLSFLDSLPFGIFHVSFEIEDVNSGRWSRIDTTLEIKAPAQKKPRLYGPIPCWSDSPDQPSKTLLELSRLSPTSRPVYVDDDDLVMYFEVHGLAQDRFDRHSCDLNYAVTRALDRSWIGRLFRGSETPAISANVETQGKGKSLISQFEIELEHADPGLYRLLLSCVDGLTGKSTSGKTDLEVCGEAELFK